MSIIRIRLLVLFAIFCGAVLLVIFLFFNSDRINTNPNSFNRIFASHVQKELKAYNNGNDAWYISGIENDTAYLAHRKYLNILLEINMVKADTSITVIDLPHYSLKTPKIKVSNKHLLILDGDQPAIYRASQSNVKQISLINNKFHFDVALPLDDASFALRFLNDKHELTLGRLENNKLTEAPNLLQGKGDGIMSRDGMLLTDIINKKIVYVDYYRNEYLVADSNMKLLYRGKTKDTTSVARVSVGKPSEDGRVIMTSPPIITNKLATLYNNFLFINSALKADNENEEFFNGSSVIDVYDIRKGLYKFSFYIPDYKNEKIKEFNVFGDKLIAMFEDQCVIYELNQKYFK